MRRAYALLLFLTLSGCRSTPPVARVDRRLAQEPAVALQRYYDGRLIPVEGGYQQKDTVYSAEKLPFFFDAQGATTSAAWAREANTFAWLGNGAGLLVLGAGIGISALAPAGDTAKSAWWASLMPAGLVLWSFHGIGHGWFRQPSVALFNKRLAEHVGLSVAPVPDEP